MSPAFTSEVFPAPEPETSSVIGCASTSEVSSPISRSRPKKRSLSRVRNGVGPTYGASSRSIGVRFPAVQQFRREVLRRSPEDLDLALTVGLLQELQKLLLGFLVLSRCIWFEHGELNGHMRALGASLQRAQQLPEEHPEIPIRQPVPDEKQHFIAQRFFDRPVNQHRIR